LFLKRALATLLLLNLLFSNVLSQQNFDSILDWPVTIFSDIYTTAGTNQLNFMTDFQINHEHNIFYSTLKYNDIYREKRNNGIKRNVGYLQQQTVLQFPVRIKNYTFELGAYFNYHNKFIDYDVIENQTYKIKNQSTDYAFSIQAPILYSFYLFGRLGTKNINSENYYSWQAGIKYVFWNMFMISYLHSDDYFQVDYSIQFDDSDLYFVYPQHYRIDQINFEYRILKNLNIGASMYFSTLEKNSDPKNEKTTFLPVGNEYNNKFYSNFIYKSFSFGFSYFNRELNFQGHFYEQKQTFGKITVLKEYSEIYKPQIKYEWYSNIFTVFVSWGNGLFNLRGHVESWPFTPTWIDLLGLRYNFKSDLDYDFKRFGFEYLFDKSAWYFKSVLCFERFYPAGETRTWEPAFLVFGVKNLKIYDLPLIRQDGLYVSFTISKQIYGDLNVSYNFSQYVPLKVKKVSSAETETAVKQSASVYGGGKHVINLSVNF